MAEINVTREGPGTGPSANQVKIASGLNILAGIWVIISPWVYGYNLEAYGSLWNSVIVGIVIAVFAAIRFFGAYGATWLSWINALLGIWLILSPFIYGFTANTARMWNSIIIGAIVVILAVWSATASRSAMRTTY